MTTARFSSAAPAAGVAAASAAAALLAVREPTLAIASVALAAAVLILARSLYLALALILGTIALFGSESLFRWNVGVELVETDALLLGAGAALLVRVLWTGTRWRPSAIDLAILAVLASFAVAAGIGLARGCDPGLLRAELRPPGYLAGAYVLARATLTSERQARALLVVLAVLAGIAAVKALAVFSIAPLGSPGGAPERIVFATRVMNSDGFKRVIVHGGEMFPLFLALALLPFGARRGSPKTVALAAMTVGVAATVVTFTRSYWVAALTGALAAIALLPPGERRRVAFSAILAVVLLTSGAFAIAKARPDLASARTLEILRHRADLPGAVATDPSVLERREESRAVLAAFAASPLLGGGLGSTYSFHSPQVRGPVEWEYTHNAYLYLLLKTGALGAVAFLVAAVAVLARLARLGRRHPAPEWRGIAVGLAGITVALLTASATAPWLSHHVGMGVFGTIAGIAQNAGRWTEGPAGEGGTP